MTKTPQEISRIFGILFYPLKIIKFPRDSIIVMTSISIRFIPIFFLEISRLYKAQVARGAKTNGFFNKIKMFILTIGPLFEFIFRNADELVMILEARGFYLKGKRTYYRKMTHGQQDIIATILMMFFIIFIFFIKFLDKRY